MTNDKHLDHQLAMALDIALTNLVYTNEVDEQSCDSIRYVIAKLRGETSSPYLEMLYSKGVH